MICYNCQKGILEESRYCYRCGAAQKPPSPPTTLRKPLRRSRKHKAIAGVCAGFADYFGLNRSLVRVIWVLAALPWLGYVGLVAYAVCWIIMPVEEVESSAPLSAFSS